MECCWNTFCILAVGAVAVVILVKYFMQQRKNNVLKKWNDTPKNKVILHGMYGGKDVPTPSPFVLKLETYLRLAKIPYEVDKSDIFGPKGKAPWISLNGQHLADSQMIMEFLGKKFDKNFSEEYSDEQRAMGLAVRIMLEEYVYWGGVVLRFQYGGRTTFKQLWAGEVPLGNWLMFQMIAPSMRSMAWSQGMGRHSEAEVLKLMSNCLQAVSKLFGNKKFVLGDKPCEEDCAAFGVLASPVFMKNSPFEEKFSGEWKNVKDYCIRMKEQYWPDWDKCLS